MQKAATLESRMETKDLKNGCDMEPKKGIKQHYCCYPFDLFAQIFILPDYFLQSPRFGFKFRRQLGFTLTLEALKVSLEENERGYDESKRAICCLSGETLVSRRDCCRKMMENL